MNIDQIIRTKEMLRQKFNFIEATFEFKEQFLNVEKFIQFIDDNPITYSIIQEEKQKFDKGGLESENSYTNYLCICDSLRDKDYNNYPKVQQDSVSLYKKLLNNLLTLEDKASNLNSFINPYFDPKTKLLYISGEKSININKQAKLNYQFTLLEYIFNQELGIEISYDDIIDEAFEKKLIRCDVACRDINKKILLKTNFGIDNFLSYSKYKKGYVKINPKYLSPN